VIELDKMIDPAVLPPLLTQFVITALISFIIGLELHSYRRANDQDLGFGTTRTFTLIGIAGFVLYLVDDSLLMYTAGLLGLVALLAIYYNHRCQEHLHSLISPLLGVLTFLIAPVLMRFPDWFAVLYMVTILLMLGEKPRIRRFSDSIRSPEIVTLSKFLVMIGVVLPLLPNRQIASFITVTYYQVWVALLVVSGLSYLGYLAQTFLFKEKGLLVTGLFGGLYSSTATTIVLGRRAREMPATPRITQAIILATAMMYLRLLLLISFLGHAQIALQLSRLFLALMLASLLAAWFAGRLPGSAKQDHADLPLSHPLEFKTALLFALLFVVFAAGTAVVLGRYGDAALDALSFLIGLTDIDPYILSLLEGKFSLGTEALLSAIIIASGSNNLMKAVYAVALGRNRFAVLAAAWLMLLFAVSMGYVLLF
jgi:uncharacterized membrane protein (DUF4010 family)